MRRPRLVVADDNPVLLKAVCALLEDTFEISGYATNGEAALVAVIDLNPDALVVDLSMPIMSGLEVATVLRKLNHRARIVLLTVHEDLECLLDEAGIHGYVFKRRIATDLVLALELALKGIRFSSPAAHKEGCRFADA